jgi:hypothetical protein
VIHGAEVPGYASLMIVVLMMGGINIIATGILGEYLGRVHIEVRNRPLYIVREAHGLNTQQEMPQWNATSISASTHSRTATGGSAPAAVSSARR